MTEKVLVKISHLSEFLYLFIFTAVQGHELTLDLQDIISIRKQKPTQVMHQL